MVGINHKLSPTQSAMASDAQIVYLDKGFLWLNTEHLAFKSPIDIDWTTAKSVATMPCTVAMLVNDEAQLATLNSEDHWFFTEFSLPEKQPKRILLQLDGLLTYAEVYINQQLVLTSSSAYHSNIIDITAHLKQSNQLTICCRAIAPKLAKKHPRPRFSTRMINERNLRFIRSPILGYTPGFSAPIQAVGPYRPIRLIYQQQVSIISSFVNAQLILGNSGLLAIDVCLEFINSHIADAHLVLLNDKNELVTKTVVNITNESAHHYRLTTQFTLEAINAYWPHTHGKPERYSLMIELNEKDSSPTTISLGKYGFRRIDRENPDTFSLKINDVPMYLRGACWTPMNPKSLLVDASQLRERLLWLQSSGMNMLRIPGNMLYESDAFYELCDELGILVFQDFAFANFDYPESDEAFIYSIQQEARHFLAKHGGRPCLTVLAGNSEVAQQASMMGLELNHLNNAIFNLHLPNIVRELAPNVPYVRSSPTADGIPFHSGNGPSHYYGVGGYRRSLEDARLFKGRFASECLAFSHVPEDESLRTFFGGEIIPPHDPRWKNSVPRDVGSGWDFTDITDHYVERLFEIDATKLRTIDQDRYLNFCRAATVEIVERTLSIFRADSAKGRGALVWFLHDLKSGAGWGYIDALGRPKSAFYGLARTAQPTAILFVDEGLEGLAVYVAHDCSQALTGDLTITLVTAEGRIYEQQQKTLTFEPRSVKRISVDLYLDRFVDSSYAYRFGPRAFSSCIATIKSNDGMTLLQNIYVNPTETHHINYDLGLTGVVSLREDGQYQLTLSCKAPAFYVVIDTPAILPADNYFHLVPGFDKVVLLKTKDKQSLPHGRIRALNTKNSYPIKIMDTE
jgi:beta-mannosidase